MCYSWRTILNPVAMLNIALILGGGLLLFSSAHYLVEYSVSVARQLGVSPFVTSLTIVAFGTSAPELVVSLNAAISGHTDVALGNIMGSNMANILIVLATAVLLSPIVLLRDAIRFEALVMLAATVLFAGLCYTREITWWNGLMMLVGLAWFSAAAYRRAHAAHLTKSTTPEPELQPECVTLVSSLGAKLAIVLLSLVTLAFGADLLLRGAVALGRNLGLSEAVIGLTIVAVGSAAPEIATALAAAWRNRAEVVVGNVLGSNIFNLLGILGITSLAAPLPVDRHFLDIDIYALLAATFWLTALCLFTPRIGRLTGGLMLTGYLVYLVILLNGGS